MVDKKVNYQNKEVSLIKPASDKIMRRWLSRQRRNKFSFFLPTATQYKKMSREDRTRWNEVRKQWNKKDTLNQARALSTASGMISSLKDKNGNQINTAGQLMSAINARSTILRGAKDSTEEGNRHNLQVMENLGIKRRDNKQNLAPKARAIIADGQPGSAFIKRDKKGNITNMADYYKVKRLINFRNTKVPALGLTDKTRYKELFEDFIVYRETNGKITILRDNEYFGTAYSARQAQEIITAQLNGDYSSMSMAEFRRSIGKNGTGWHERTRKKR